MPNITATELYRANINGHERRTSLSHSHSSRFCYPASRTSQTSHVGNTGLKIYLGDYSKNSLSESNMLCFEQLKIQNIKVYIKKSFDIVYVKASVFRAGKWLRSAVKHLTSKLPTSMETPAGCVYLLVMLVLSRQSQGTPAMSSPGRLVETVSSCFN